MTTTPEWFAEEFRATAMDWFRDLEAIPDDVDDDDRAERIDRAVARRADQLWAMIATHEPSTADQLWGMIAAHESSTAVSNPGPVAPTGPPTFGAAPGPTHPYDPADTVPVPTTVTDPNPGGSDGRVWATVPTRDGDGMARTTALRVTREATDNRAPRIDCADCGGNGEINTPTGDLMCDTCLGTGTVTAPPTEPRPDGAVPEDHPMMRPPTEEERTARAALPVDPNTAAAVAAVQARTAALGRPPE
jgi:hypothetical protein